MKSSQKLLIGLTLVFAAFLAGLFIGRNFNAHPVQLQPISVPTATAPQVLSDSTGVTEPLIVNINIATVQQLQTLPGIGPTIAQRIVAYREENGNFEIVGELMNVPGIGEKKLETIWDYVTTGG